MEVEARLCKVMENQGINHDRKAMAVFQRVPPYLGIEMLKSQTGLQNQFNITDYQLTTDYLHDDIQKKMACLAKCQKLKM